VCLYMNTFQLSFLTLSLTNGEAITSFLFYFFICAAPFSIIWSVQLALSIRYKVYMATFVSSIVGVIVMAYVFYVCAFVRFLSVIIIYLYSFVSVGFRNIWWLPDDVDDILW
jgi:hypothetical protein